jgi:PAS domain S-box-containing protein
MSGSVAQIDSEQKLITKLFDEQPDAVIWFVPKFSDTDKNIPIDFTVGYCNHSTCTLLKVTKHELTGASLLSSPLIDDRTRQNIMDQCLQVWKTGASQEFTHYAAMAQKYFCVQRSKMLNGVLSFTRDHTRFVEDHLKKEQQTKLLDQIIETSISGICLYEAIRDKNGKIVDFRMRLANKKSSEITGFSLEELKKYTTKELMVIRGQTGLFEILVKVVETGEPVYMEYQAEARHQWVAFSIKKFEDGYLLNYIDITERKRLEKKANDQAEMLSGILNASVTGLLSLEAIYSLGGKILDFKFILLNGAAEKLLGIKEEDKGKTLLQVFPASKNNGFFELYSGVLQTGVSVSKEFFYKGDGYNGWYYISVSKMNAFTLVQSFSDITHTKTGSDSRTVA